MERQSIVGHSGLLQLYASHVIQKPKGSRMKGRLFTPSKFSGRRRDELPRGGQTFEGIGKRRTRNSVLLIEGISKAGRAALGND